MIRSKKAAALLMAAVLLCVPAFSFAETRDADDGQNVLDEARKFISRPVKSEGADAADPMKALEPFQSEKHEQFVGMLERYLAQFIEKAKGTDSALMKELLELAESIKGSIRSYLAKLDHMRGAIDVAREANGLPAGN